MSKLKIGVIFGGTSTEHDVSIASGTSVIKNLDKETYEVLPIYIGKDNKWYLYNEKVENIKNLKVGEQLQNLEQIENIFDFLRKIDVAFPVLHGLYGEDGTIQGLFEMLQIPYVGTKVLASSISMDKVYTKALFEKAQIKQTPYVYIRKHNNQYIYINEVFEETRYNIEETCQTIENKLQYPVFVKPSNSGSSVGVKKAKNLEELKEAILFAEQYDRKIIIEEGVIGKEIECSVLGNEDVIASCTGEIIPADEFYSYDAKYYNEESICKIPSVLPEKVEEEVRKTAIKVFKLVDGSGLSRVDFFVTENEEVYINEINTMPGFTEISMYSKLWEASGVSYKELLKRLIALATEQK